MNLTDKLFEIANMGAEWVLWVLVGLSIISVAIIAERLFFIWRRRVNVAQLQKSLAEIADRDKLNTVARELASLRAMEAQVLSVGLARHEMGATAVSELMNGALTGQRQEYERFLPFLATVGSNAPFIGLFGTVLGIIQAFAVFDLADGANASAGIMGAISEALIATGVGLIVAIPAVIAFNFLKSCILSAIANTDQLARTVIAYLLAEKQQTTASESEG